MSVGAELTALSSTLEELTRRVTRILAELDPADEERYGYGPARSRAHPRRGQQAP